MKISARHDLEVPPARLFDAISDFSRIERMLLNRGVAITRIDPGTGAGPGPAWQITFDWRGRARQMRVEVERIDAPERIVMTGRSDPFDLRVEETVVALSRHRARLLVEAELRARTMKSILLLQTARLNRGAVLRRFQKRVSEFATELTGQG